MINISHEYSDHLSVLLGQFQILPTVIWEQTFIVHSFSLKSIMVRVLKHVATLTKHNQGLDVTQHIQTRIISAVEHIQCT